MAEPKRIIEARAAAAYPNDFVEWIDAQVQLLADRRFDELDIENLAEEVSALGKREFRAFQSAIRVIIHHMLKWDYQPEMRSMGWRKSIHTQRGHVEAILSDSPSLRRRADEAIQGVYDQARRDASFETTVFLANFPEACPYTFDEIMTRRHEFQADSEN